MRPSAVVRALVPLLVVVAAAVAPPARAGGGPETTVVVVNGASPTSRRVANAWVAWRHVPADNVCVLDDVPLGGIVSLETFRARLWGPVKAFLEARGLLDRVDCVAWSADFPYAVDFAAEKPDKDMTPPWTRLASLNAMTYLWRRVESKQADAYLGTAANPLTNQYYRRAPSEVGLPRDLTDAEAALRNDAQAAVVEKRWADAVKAYEALLATIADVESLYNLACCLARLARPDDAVATLARTVGAGYADAAHAGADPDFASVKDRPDFQALLAKMAQQASADVQPSHGFRAGWGWAGGTEPVVAPAEDNRDRYLLSVALAYTGEWGNSATEALAALEAAAKADGTNPDGTFYFLSNADVRATTRAPRFAGAVEALKSMGRKAEVLTAGEDGQSGIVPVGKEDVLGAMLGSAGFTWKDGRSRIVPGAIVEHLTSHGADFAHGGQTKLCELIRNGAAGASGTVYEPYAVQFKFPVPAIHVHYAAGCSLAEAFYQSLAGPYQTYVVGDPLCRPFARFAKVTPTFPEGALAGTVSVAVAVEPPAGVAVDHLEAFVDGRPVGTSKPGEPFALDTTTLDDGDHDVRLVAVEAGAVATRSDAVATVTVANGKRTLALAGPATAAWGDTVTLTGKVLGAQAVELTVGGRRIAPVTLTSEGFKATFPAASVGPGPVAAVARATFKTGPAVRAQRALVVSPPPLRKHPKPDGKKAGLLCALFDKTGKDKGSKDAKAAATLDLATLGGAGQAPTVRDAIAAKGPGPWKSVHVDGEFEVPVAGLFQLYVTAAGDLSIDVDGKPALATTRVEAGKPFGVLVGLEAGWHDLAIRYAPTGAPDLTVLLGGDRVTAPLSGAGIRQHGK